MKKTILFLALLVTPLLMGVNEIFQFGPVPLRSNSNEAGHVYFGTDGPHLVIESGTDSATDTYATRIFELEAPFAASFTYGLNWDGNATYTFSTSSLKLYGDKTGEVNSYTTRLLLATAPGTPWEVTLGATYETTLPNPAQWFLFGIVVRDSTTGKLVLCSQGSGPGTAQQTTNPCYYLTSPASMGSAPAGVTAVPKDHPNSPCFIRLVDDGTNFGMYLSYDGSNFHRWVSVSRTAYLASPDQVGIFFYDAAAAIQQARIIHWRLTQ